MRGASVLESAEVGVPHSDFGEAGVAEVVPRVGAEPELEKLLATLKTQLASFRFPKHCVVVPEMPRSTMGKVQKNLLRAAHGELFVPMPLKDIK